MRPGLREEIAAIYEGRATRGYGLTLVHQLGHALQSAHAAERAGEGPAMILAALLHDVGHMVHDLGENPADHGVDDRHEEIGALWLSDRLPPSVAEPVRLHVAAKRYLVGTEPGYADLLGKDSVRSLELQGGPMARDEAAAFIKRPWAEEAVRLRRYDELAKDPKAVTPGLDHFLAYLARL